jgi:lipoyl synthase
LPAGEAYTHIKGLREGLRLATVCEEARCPNMAECWGAGTATFMLLGDTCTRFCKFCNVKTGNPRQAADPREPENILQAVRDMRLRYVVLTMVDRDDLPDGGAGHVARVIRLLRTAEPDLTVEMLAGDFQGREDQLQTVLDGGAHVFAHNVETVRRLTPEVRDRRCGYDQSLAVLAAAKRRARGVVTKSSIMLGLGETDDEVERALADLLAHQVEIVTLGQYLRPAPKFLPVVEYVHPDKFAHWQRRAEAMGFAYCASGPLVRSSYRASEVFVAGYLGRQAAPGHSGAGAHTNETAQPDGRAVHHDGGCGSAPHSDESFAC